jgi:hypothetical protein
VIARIAKKTGPTRQTVYRIKEDVVASEAALAASTPYGRSREVPDLIAATRPFLTEYELAKLANASSAGSRPSPAIR